MAKTGSYRINFNAYGGSGAPASITGTTMATIQQGTEDYYQANVTLPSTKPSRTYYTFQGWGGQGASSASWSAGGTYVIGTTLSLYVATLYAVWKRNTAYVYYNANGGSGAPSTQSHNAGTSIKLSATIPTRTGYNFLGWATSATATTKQYDPNTTYNLYNTVTLYAVWESVLSSITVSNGTLGESQSITISNYDSTKYTTTITWKFGTQSGTIVTKTSGASTSWTPAVSLASEIPNSNVGAVTYTVTTYQNNTAIGTTTKSATLAVPATITPSCSATFSDTNAVSSGFGLYVQSRSALSFSITAAGQYGATIASYATSVNGANYTTSTFTTAVLLYNGTNTYTVTVTDSRGLQTTITGTFNVVTYTAPAVSNIVLERDDMTESTINLTFDYSVASVNNNNAKTYAISYKLRTADNYTDYSNGTLPDYSGTLSLALDGLQIDPVKGFDVDLEFDILVTVSDSYSTDFGAASAGGMVGTSNSLMLQSQHVGGLGFGMKSQGENRNDFKYPIYPRKGTAVYSNSTSGEYAKVLTLGTNVQVGKNLLNDVNPDVKNAYLTGAYKLGASANDRVVIIPINPNTDYTFTWNRVAIEGASSDDTNVLLFAEYPVIGTTVGTSTGVNTTSNPAIRTFNSGNNVYAAIKIANINKTQYQETLSASQFELGTSSTSHEAYVNPSNINVTAPITLEYARTGDNAPTRLTINFAADYTLNSFTSDRNAAYLVNSAAATWDLYIDKDNSNDSVEILDFHNSWRNSDVTVEFENQAVNSLPSGSVQAEAIPPNLVNEYGDLAYTGDAIYNNGTEISLATSTYKTVAQFTLPAGLWVISGGVRFGMNNTGRRRGFLSTSRDGSSDVAYLLSDEIKGWADGSGHANSHFCSVLRVSANTTYYLNAWQNSGSALNALGRLMAVRICK